MHRVTLWRRKQQPPRPLGRKRQSTQKRKRIFALLAAGLEQFRTVGRVDLATVNPNRSSPSENATITRLENYGASEMLLAIECLRLMRHGSRSIRKRSKPVDAKAVQKRLKVVYPHLTSNELNAAILANPNADWIRAATEQDDGSDKSFSTTDKNECPSKFIPGLSRRMVSYWRTKTKTDMEDDAIADLLWLVHPSKSHSGRSPA